MVAMRTSPRNNHQPLANSPVPDWRPSRGATGLPLPGYPTGSNTGRDRFSSLVFTKVITTD